MAWKTKGMNQDFSVSALKNDHFFENKNLRLSTKEDNTLMSWVNERGTKEVTIIDADSEEDALMTIEGHTVGTAVLNDYLVLFTTSYTGEDVNTLKTDRIYRLKIHDLDKAKFEGVLLFQGALNLSTKYPLETLVSYEVEHVQKVYWTDGRNQPRLINIADDSRVKLDRWAGSDYDGIASFFDFVPAVKYGETFNITQHISSSGIFAPGVIQYCFTYINKYGQETNIIDTSPLYYLTYADRGAAADETNVTCSFDIIVSNVDANYDYVRLYSIQWSSLNGTQLVKQLVDLVINEYKEDEIESVIEYDRGNYSNWTLPVDSDGNKIYTAAIKNGTCDIVFEDNPKGYKGNLFFDTIGFSNATTYSNLQNRDGNIILQSIIDDERYRSLIVIDKYYAYVDFSKEGLLYRELRNNAHAQGLHYGIGILAGGSPVFFDEAGDWKAVYSYVDRCWYFTCRPIFCNEHPGLTTYKHVRYVDNGTAGFPIDYWKLLYIGGKEISALTMAEKSQTLFLGNITERNLKVDDIQYYYDNLREGKIENKTLNIEFKNGYVTESDDEKTYFKAFDMPEPSGLYPYELETKENQRKISTFKGGETYRFGFQLQKTTGEWSDPIFLNDVANDKYPVTALYDRLIKLVYAEATIPIPSDVVKTSLYKRIRPVIVYPNIQDRTILCQGILNPTVFNAKCRAEGMYPFSQSSWYFRPFMVNTDDDVDFSRLTYKCTKTEHNNSTDYNSGLPDNLLSDDITTAYILVVRTFRSDVIAYLRNEGEITFRKYLGSSTTASETRTHSFYGILRVGTVTDGSLGDAQVYAFLSSTPWKPDTFNTQHGYYDRDLEPGESQDAVCAGSAANNGLWYYWLYDHDTEDEKAYQVPAYHWLIFDSKYNVVDAPNGYVFKCSDLFKDYSVTFHAAWQTIGKAGESVEFNHYHPLLAQDDIVSLYDSASGIQSIDSRKKYQIEIMGSHNSYKDWKSKPTRTDTAYKDSNTEFFIDQSIVTFHSPDIEFDTSVQLWKEEDIKLRIVGAVPITGTKSNHSIIITGKMLETNHSENKGGNVNYNYGKGETKFNVYYPNINPSGGKRLVAAALWNDVAVKYIDEDKYGNTRSSNYTIDYIIHPWHRDTTLTNDFSREDVASQLKWKKESNLLFSYNTEYLNSADFIQFSNIESKIMLTENSHVSNYKLKRQLSTMSSINYYPNVDTVLYNKDSYLAMTENDMYPDVTDINEEKVSDYLVNGPISMKYKSTSHAILALGEGDSYRIRSVGVLPYCSEPNNISIGKIDEDLLTGGKSFWGDTVKFYQDGIDTGNMFKQNDVHVPHNLLWIGEIVKEPKNRFGGNTKDALRNNIWTIAGDTVDLSDSGSVTLQWTDGDTYYQRYDCLKTYAFTQEDPNQIVEILSFMCETHINIDGRCDKFRGEDKNYSMRPDIFNTMNYVYSQQNNFFPNQKTDTEDWKGDLTYPNRAWFSMTHTSGADVDNWTNVVLSSAVEFDGDKGGLNAIRRLNDTLIAFQDTGISQILYNEQMQISTKEGVPIEVSNSGKVQGVRYFSDTVGCSNRWSTVTTPSGIYFMDSENKNIYLFNGQLKDIGVALGFDVWCKNKIKAGKNWSPIDFDEDFVSYYDPINQEVLFIDSEEALAYSEKIVSFTSFYDYGNTPYFCTVKDASIWVKPDADNTKLWLHQQGEYCNFFGENKDYYTVLIANDNPTQDKIFTNLEFRACIEGKEEDANTHNKDLSTLPFDTIEAWNEYQKGKLYLKDMKGHTSMKHYWQKDTSLKRKFRMWRCDIPRDGRDRMRNPWLYVKLHKDAATPGNFLDKMELHDFILTYFS